MLALRADCIVRPADSYRQQGSGACLFIGELQEAQNGSHEVRTPVVLERQKFSGFSEAAASLAPNRVTRRHLHLHPRRKRDRAR